MPQQVCDAGLSRLIVFLQQVNVWVFVLVNVCRGDEARSQPVPAAQSGHL